MWLRSISITAIITLSCCSEEPGFYINDFDANTTDTDTINQIDTDFESDTDTEISTDTQDTEDLDSDDIDTEEETDDSDSDSTDTDTSCPWECKKLLIPYNGYYSCDPDFDDDLEIGPEFVHNWNYDCKQGRICCQPRYDPVGLTEYCLDFDDTHCRGDADCKTPQVKSRYCFAAMAKCCLN